MSCTSWTAQDLVDIEKAIAQGALIVKYEDRTVTYRSLEDMRSIRREIQDCINPVPPDGSTPYGTKRWRVATHKDLD